MSKDVKVDFTGIVKTLQGEDMKEQVGVGAVIAVLVQAGMSAMMIERAKAALKPLWESGEPEDKPLTYGACVVNALSAPDNACPGAERVDRMRLAMRVLESERKKELCELKEVEVATIKKSVEKGYDSPVLYFRIDDLLSQDSAPPLREGLH